MKKEPLNLLTQELNAKTQRIEELQAELASKNIRIQELDAAVTDLNAVKSELTAENEGKKPRQWQNRTRHLILRGLCSVQRKN